MTADADESSHDLAPARADGWFERVVEGVPALARLCETLGDGLVALSLAAGFRLLNATVDRESGNVARLSWVREAIAGSEPTEATGDPAQLRTEVLAALIGESDGTFTLPPAPDAIALREAVGPRYVLLAPLFGIELRTLLVAPEQEPRVAVMHGETEEVVSLKQLRRFLRARVLEVLQGPRGRNVAIDLGQLETGRTAFAEGRFDEVVARFAGWLGPLAAHLRSPEASRLDAATRGGIAGALSLLGHAYGHLGRFDEADETLRAAVQYALETPSGAATYRTLAAVLVLQNRHAEAIAPLRRARALQPDDPAGLLELAHCFLVTRRGVAAIECHHELRARSPGDPAVDQLARDLAAYFGDALARYEARLVAPAAADVRDTTDPPDA